ncbi:hypothetical protein [Phaeobacter inhibens]|uniref:hypothetical protein n=1 Tax=Phaeobacter inhibens TaxID=221822 RepID=UPI0021A74497|nr:hypothetical protein [Phaeobacter inhibens]
MSFPASATPVTKLNCLPNSSHSGANLILRHDNSSDFNPAVRQLIHDISRHGTKPDESDFHYAIPVRLPSDIRFSGRPDGNFGYIRITSLDLFSARLIGMLGADHYGAPRVARSRPFSEQGSAHELLKTRSKGLRP